MSNGAWFRQKHRWSKVRSVPRCARSGRCQVVRLLSQEHCATTFLSTRSVVDRHPPFWKRVFAPWFCFRGVAPTRHREKQTDSRTRISAAFHQICSWPVIVRTYLCYALNVPNVVRGIIILFSHHIVEGMDVAQRRSEEQFCAGWGVFMVVRSDTFFRSALVASGL
jgi:hypothetical protein